MNSGHDLSNAGLLSSRAIGEFFLGSFSFSGQFLEFLLLGNQDSFVFVNALDLRGKFSSSFNPPISYRTLMLTLIWILTQ